MNEDNELIIKKLTEKVDILNDIVINISKSQCVSESAIIDLKSTVSALTVRLERISLLQTDYSVKLFQLTNHMKNVLLIVGSKIEKFKEDQK